MEKTKEQCSNAHNVNQFFHMMSLFELFPWEGFIKSRCNQRRAEKCDWELKSREASGGPLPLCGVDRRSG